ncbi:MAG: GNAT family N-acetyltransferase [Armatimonadetes bacterium]|nr:GNAT family N-acetyltransferase [Armatimonadota bacterium]
MKPLETERLLLRVFCTGDLEDVYREVYSDPDVANFYCGRTKTREETQEWLAFRTAEWGYTGSFGRLAVARKNDRALLGMVGLDAYVNNFARFPDDPAPRFNDVEVELSFAFGKRYWGQGYAFEASQALIRFAFEDRRLRRLVGGAALENERSRRLQERLGFRVMLTADGGGYITILENTLIPEKETGL